MPRARSLLFIIVALGTLNRCLPEPDCTQTATCPPDFVGDGSDDSSRDASEAAMTDRSVSGAGGDARSVADATPGLSDGRVDEGGSGTGTTTEAGETNNPPTNLDSGAGVEASAPVVCQVGDTRPCSPYPFAPAIPDETACRDGKPCTAPCKAGTQTCIAADGGGPFWGNCQGTVAPNASDTCDPGNDGNCNGVANEGCGCVNGTTKSCGEALGAKGKCATGTTTCAGGAWGGCSVAALPSDNCAVAGDDSNCNGLTNDTCPCTGGETGTCAAKLGAKGACASGVATCNASGSGWTCSIIAAAKDTCDPGNDATCDGNPNQGCACVNGATATCADALHLVGPCSSGTITCANGAWGACSIKPSNDTCDRGNDNNCDGVANNPPGGCACINGTTATCGTALGARGTCAGGTAKCASGAWGACSILAAESDTCDRGNDNNCNGIGNENCACVNGASCSDGNACTQTDTCVNGGCVGSNPVVGTNCNSACVNLLTDSLNCGACGTRCAAGLTCIDGTCGCASGSTSCNGACVNLQNDPLNCGSCGFNCASSGFGCTRAQCSCALRRRTVMGACETAKCPACASADSACCRC